MSLLFLDSFDHYDEPELKWDALFFATNILPVQSQGRFTPGALQMKGTGGGGSITKNLPETTEIIVGFAHLNADSSTRTSQFTLGTVWSASDYRLTVNTTTGVITLTGGNGGGEIISTAGGVATGGVWQFIEFRIKLHASLGELEIRVGNSVEASVTGVNTITSTGVALLNFAVVSTHNSQFSFIDDLYISNTDGTVNNTFVGDSRITVLRPKANGSSISFTPTGAATNYETQDETLCDKDVSFVESGQIGSRDNYDNVEFEDLGVVPGTIYGVQVVNAALKTDAGELRYLDEMTVAGVTYDNGVEVTATSGAYKMTRFIRDTDPSDDGTWTEDKVAAVGSGFSITFREV